MDSRLLTSSYERYKIDTNTFVTWLSEQATASGHVTNIRPAPTSTSSSTPTIETETEIPSTSAPLSLGEKLREKAAKKAQKRETKKVASQPPSTSTKHKITTTRELLLQAKIVAQNGKVRMSASLVRVVQRAIDARKRFASFFQESEPQNGSNQTHAHFIGVLEQSLDILEPCIIGNTAEKKKETVFENRFQRLSVDEVVAEDGNDEDEDEDEEVLETKINPSTTKANVKNQKSANSTEPDCELELPDNLAESLFATYCFFEDTHRIQDFLKNLWQEYKEGKCDLITASFITNTAIDMVKTEEAKIPYRLYPGHKPRYFELIDALFMTILVPEDLRNKEMTEDELFEYRSRIQSGFVKTPYDELFYRWTARYALKNHQHWEAIQAIYPLITRDLDQEKVDLAEFPEWRERVADDIFLSEMMSEVLLSWMSGSVKDGESFFKYFSPTTIPDRFAEEVKELGDKKHKKRALPQLTMTTTFIFSSQVLLDIHHILGDRAKESLEELLSLEEKTKAAFGLEIDMEEFGHATKIEDVFNFSGEAPDPKNLGPFLRLTLRKSVIPIDAFDFTKQRMVSTFCKLPVGEAWVKYGTPSEKREEFLNSWAETRWTDLEDEENSTLPPKVPHEGNDEEPSLVGWFDNEDRRTLRHFTLTSEEPFFFANNPSNCGTRLLEYSLDVEETGTSIANYHWCIYLVSHLYNAAKQVGLLEKTWPEMERMIELHSDTLFGGKRPESVEQIYSRFTLAYGFKPSEQKYLERTGRLPGPDRFGRYMHEQGPKAKLQCTKTSKILQKLADENNPINLQQCLYQINGLIEDDLASKSKNKSRKRQQPQLTYVEMLQRLRDWLPQAVNDMKIDYVELNRACRNILFRIRLTILIELKIDHMVALKPVDKGAEPGFPAMVWDIFNENARFNNVSGKKGGEEVVSPQMLVVGKVLRKVLGEEGGEGGAMENHTYPEQVRYGPRRSLKI